jgi:chaperonin GroEL
MILKNDETRAKILEGAELLYDAVRTTMGPRGRNVLIKNKFGEFSITHDGVTVAKAVKSDDHAVQMGIDLIKEASKKMDMIGDGTTSVTVLTYHLIVAMDKLVQQGVNPMQIKRELEAMIEPLLTEVDTRSKTIERTYDGVYNVARISVEDDELAKAIATLVVGTGYEGAITVETHKADTYFELTEGYLLPGGYASPYFVTDDTSKQAVLLKPAVLLVDGSITHIRDYAQLLDDLLGQGVKDILIVADNVENDVLSLLLLNKAKGSFNATLVKNYVGKERLYDLAAVTGATPYNPNIGDGPELDGIGGAEKVIVSENETIIVGGAGDVASRIKSLEVQSKKDPSDDLAGRISALSNKIGTIRVGGTTDMEAQEKKYRIDDAVGATRAAIKGGIVAGGGATLYDLSRTLTDKENPVKAAVIEVLRMPQAILLENSGVGYHINTDALEYPLGINVTTNEVVDMMDAGIVDPTIVTKEVIRNAFSVAAIAITVGGSIVEPAISKEELATLMGAAH